jgi:hypothetical protein
MCHALLASRVHQGRYDSFIPWTSSPCRGLSCLIHWATSTADLTRGWQDFGAPRRQLRAALLAQWRKLKDGRRRGANERAGRGAGPSPGAAIWPAPPAARGPTRAAHGPSLRDRGRREGTPASSAHANMPLGQSTPTGLNGTQCVSKGTLGRTSMHLVDPERPGLFCKKPGWKEVRRYVRIVEVEGSSPFTSTTKSLVRGHLRGPRTPIPQVGIGASGLNVAFAAGARCSPQEGNHWCRGPRQVVLLAWRPGRAGRI